ncbi:MAG: hypothetical protein AAB014_05190, partial [Nitrospirota bacterium]
RCKRGVWGHRRSNCTARASTDDRRLPLNARFARWLNHFRVYSPPLGAFTSFVKDFDTPLLAAG